MSDTATLIVAESYTASQAAVPTHPHHEGEGQPFRGVIVTVEVTDLNEDTPEITVAVQGHTVAEGVGTWADVVATSTIDATGTYQLIVHPGIEDVANYADKSMLPYRWRVNVEHADEKAIDYSVSYEGIR